VGTVSTVRADEVAAVAAGGVLGALARAEISFLVPHRDEAAWPWATFVTNLLGCLVLGIVLDWVDNRHDGWKSLHPRRARLMRPLLASGVLGGFTTFSTFSAEAFGLLRSDRAAAAVTYAVGSAVLGVALVLLGRALGARAFGASALDLREDEAL
jgi:fluoride exporter